MKNLFIHIGIHKTGSSAIQEHLLFNKQILEKNKILYLNGFKSKEVQDAMKANNFRSKMELFYKFFNQNNIIKNFEYNTYVISRATFSGDYPNYENSETFAKALYESTKDNFNVKIILYIRNIYDFIESIYNQNLKINPKYFEFGINGLIENLHIDKVFKNTIQNYEKYFSKKNILISNYSEFKNYELIKDFFKKIRINNNIRLIKKISNSRISSNQINFYYNLFKHLNNDEINIVRETLMSLSSFNFLYVNNKKNLLSFLNNNQINDIHLKFKNSGKYIYENYGIIINNKKNSAKNIQNENIILSIYKIIIFRGIFGNLYNSYVFEKIININEFKISTLNKVNLRILLKIGTIITKSKKIIYKVLRKIKD